MLVGDRVKRPMLVGAMLFETVRLLSLLLLVPPLPCVSEGSCVGASGCV